MSTYRAEYLNENTTTLKIKIAMRTFHLLVQFSFKFSAEKEMRYMIVRNELRYLIENKPWKLNIY